MMGLDPWFLARAAILVLCLPALWVVRRSDHRAPTGATVVGWAGIALSLVTLLDGGEAATYLVAAAVAFGLAERR